MEAPANPLGPVRRLFYTTIPSAAFTPAGRTGSFAKCIDPHLDSIYEVRDLIAKAFTFNQLPATSLFALIYAFGGKGDDVCSRLYLIHRDTIKLSPIELLTPVVKLSAHSRAQLNQLWGGMHRGTIVELRNEFVSIIKTLGLRKEEVQVIDLELPSEDELDPSKVAAASVNKKRDSSASEPASKKAKAAATTVVNIADEEEDAKPKAKTPTLPPPKATVASKRAVSAVSVAAEAEDTADDELAPPSGRVATPASKKAKMAAAAPPPPPPEPESEVEEEEEEEKAEPEAEPEPEAEAEEEEPEDDESQDANHEPSDHEDDDDDDDNTPAAATTAASAASSSSTSAKGKGKQTKGKQAKGKGKKKRSHQFSPVVSSIAKKCQAADIQQPDFYSKMPHPPRSSDFTDRCNRDLVTRVLPIYRQHADFKDTVKWPTDLRSSTKVSALAFQPAGWLPAGDPPKCEGFGCRAPATTTGNMGRFLANHVVASCTPCAAHFFSILKIKPYMVEHPTAFCMHCLQSPINVEYPGNEPQLLVYEQRRPSGETSLHQPVAFCQTCLAKPYVALQLRQRHQYFNQELTTKLAHEVKVIRASWSGLPRNPAAARAGASAAEDLKRREKIVTAAAAATAAAERSGNPKTKALADAMTAAAAATPVKPPAPKPAAAAAPPPIYGIKKAAAPAAEAASSSSSAASSSDEESDEEESKDETPPPPPPKKAAAAAAAADAPKLTPPSPPKGKQTIPNPRPLPPPNLPPPSPMVTSPAPPIMDMPDPNPTAAPASAPLKRTILAPIIPTSVRHNSAKNTFLLSMEAGKTIPFSLQQARDFKESLGISQERPSGAEYKTPHDSWFSEWQLVELSVGRACLDQPPCSADGNGIYVKLEPVPRAVKLDFIHSSEPNLPNNCFRLKDMPSNWKSVLDNFLSKFTAFINSKKQ